MRRSTSLIVLSAAFLGSGCMDTSETVGPETVAGLAPGGNSQPGFVTGSSPQAALVVGGSLTPLATAGDVLPGGEQLVGVPDGIGIWGGGRYMNLYLNHEIGGASRVSRFVIDTKDVAIDSHEYTIDGTEGYNRLCSAEWVDAGDGFPGGYFFTGEESSDGRQLAIDAQGRVTELTGVGLYAHENQISVPGFPGHVVVLNFDDRGTSGVGRAGASSEVYMYVARSTNQVLQSQGTLYVFAADDPDLFPNDLSVDTPIPGHWVEVPEELAQDASGLNSFSDDPDVLSFPFMRVEDGFYDKRPGASPAAFFFDTGRSSITHPDDGSVVDPWGSIYRLDFEDPQDPAGGTTTLTLLARSTGPAGMWASPDNGDMNDDGLIMLQEDPANGPWVGHEPSIYALQLANGSLVDPVGTQIATVPGSNCIGGGNCWETSGIVDASEWFGPGSWIFDVQAHGEAVPGCPDCVEDGQLVLMLLD